jgi:hypothetical protein
MDQNDIRNFNDGMMYATRRTNYWKPGKIPRGFYDDGPASVKWLFSDNAERYALNDDKTYGIDDITYDINSHGYRSMEFDPESTAKKIMFLGCSFTTGMGLPYHEVWTTVLTKRLSEHFGVEIEQHNFGLPSHGADAMAMVAFQAIPVVKPDMVIVMYPDIVRRSHFFAWDFKAAFIPTAPQSWWEGEFLDAHKAYIKLSTDPNDFFEWRRNHALIETAASQSGSKMLWGLTWPRNIRFVEGENLAEYVDTVPFCPDVHFVRDGNMARDGIHLGKASNQAVADKWFDVIIQSSEAFE